MVVLDEMFICNAMKKVRKSMVEELEGVHEVELGGRVDYYVRCSKRKGKNSKYCWTHEVNTVNRVDYYDICGNKDTVSDKASDKASDKEEEDIGSVSGSVSGSVVSILGDGIDVEDSLDRKTVDIDSICGVCYRFKVNKDLYERVREHMKELTKVSIECDITKTREDTEEDTDGDTDEDTDEDEDDDCDSSEGDVSGSD